VFNAAPPVSKASFRGPAAGWYAALPGRSEAIDFTEGGSCVKLLLLAAPVAKE
jgi:hypothetical protein